MTTPERDMLDTELVEIWVVLPEILEELGAGSPEFWREMADTIERFRKEYPAHVEYVEQRFDEVFARLGLQRPARANGLAST